MLALLIQVRTLAGGNSCSWNFRTLGDVNDINDLNTSASISSLDDSVFNLRFDGFFFIGRPGRDFSLAWVYNRVLLAVELNSYFL